MTILIQGSLEAFPNLFYKTSLNSGFRSSLYPAYCAYFPRPLSLFILAQYATLARILSKLYVSVFAVVRSNSNSHEPCKYEKAKDDCMTSVVLRLVFARVDECWRMDKHVIHNMGRGIVLLATKPPQFAIVSCIADVVARL